MGLILDTNVLIDNQLQRFNLNRLPTNEGRYFIPHIVLSEFLVGQYITSDPTVIASVTNYALAITRSSCFIPFNYKVAEAHAKLFQHARSNGKNAHDIIIAATAIAYNMKVVTRNVRDFASIPGLPDIIDTSTL